MFFPKEFVVNQFIRVYLSPFSVQEFDDFLSDCGVHLSKRELLEILNTNENIFSLRDNFYATRACAFTGQYFSIKPTRRELELDIFIPGHRCMPFVDPDMLSYSFSFMYNGEKLTTREVEFESTAAQEFFSLYGYEYAPQYIAQDEANKEKTVYDSEYIMVPKVSLTGIDMLPLKNDGFEYGDRLLCKVIDWDKSIIEISFEHKERNQFQMTQADFERENWFKNLEKYLLESFDILGPKGSMEEQLSLVFAQHREELCIKNCGSIEELFDRSKKVGFELFGVETRIWRKGEEIPAVGKWNSIEFEEPEEEIRRDFSQAIFEQMPEYVTDAFIHDQLFNNEENFEQILLKLYPDFYKINVAQRKLMLLHLKTRHDIILRTYNKFADFEIANIRRDILDLFCRVNELVYTIDITGSDLSVYPQQSLVILSQLFAHIMHILEVLELSPSSFVKEVPEIEMSLEGMELNFEAVNEELSVVLAREAKNGFNILK